MSKPLLVGETNPYSDDPSHAMLPWPNGCAGHRLCHRIFGMSQKDYLRHFDRVDLVVGKWSMKRARVRATELADTGLAGDEEQPIIILGSKVADAFGLPYRPFEQFGEDMLILPHPSGLCRIWHAPDAIFKAREAVVKMCPHLVSVIGSVSTKVTQES